jgi:hypothetical protein
MNIGEIGQLLTGLAAAVAAINSLRNSRKIDAVHESTNGKMDALIELTRSSSFAAGQKDEQDKAPQ